MPRWLSLVLVLMLAAPVALADDDEGDEGREEDDHERDGQEGEGGEDDDREGDDHREKRKLSLDVGDLKANIKLERDLAGVEESVKIGFDAEKAKLEVKREMEDARNESEQKLEARFLALLEYVDGNGNGAYDAGETIASAYSLGNAEKDAKVPTNASVEWSSILVTDVASGNVTGKKLSSRASFGPNATFGLDFYVYGAFTLVGDAPLEPTEAKVDIIIQHYPYVRADSALAVLVDLKAKEEFKSEDRDDDDGPGVFSEMTEGNLSFRLRFTWLPNATVDGVDRAIHSTLLKDRQEAGNDEIEHKARVAIGYPRGDLIVHDPTVGVSYETASATTRDVPFPAVALALAACVVSAVIRRRRAS